MNKRLFNFLDIVFESLEENLEVVKKQLEEAGVDYQGSLEDTLNQISKEEAKLKIERGRKLKANLGTLKERIFKNNWEVHDRQQLLYAYRNLESVTEDDIKEIEEDEQLLKTLDIFIKNELQ